MKEKILLTGATGFLGSHVLIELIAGGYEVVILTRDNSNLTRISHLKGYSIFKVDDDLCNLEVLFIDYEISIIIHLATEYGRFLPLSAVMYSNVEFPVRLLKIAQRNNVKLFINTDTFFSKFVGSSYLKNYCDSKRIFKEQLKSQREIQVVNLQLEHVFGENDSKGKFIPTLIRRLYQNDPSIELTCGTQRRDFIYVKDVVSAYLLVVRKIGDLPDRFSEFEVGHGYSVTLRDFVEEVHCKLKSRTVLQFCALSTIDDIQESQAANESLISLGWSIKNSMSDGIIKTISLTDYEFGRQDFSKS